jgi:alkanesulfonate monooxygenase SsuD/methylene tetrahydromethanopterin reductase-like flavin-dependent oxidoreductase (luciferase family)
VATLDLISGGRVEFGTGESASRAELDGFGIDHTAKREMWAEATAQIANMMAMTPYPGFDGQFFSMPARNVVPKPFQKPHPPLWVACSRRETIHLAARNGVGALTFAFVGPEEAGKWAQEYYDIIKSDECVPIGHSVNANIACITGFSVHDDAAEARRRGQEGFKFFGYCIGHYYIYGEHRPGYTDVWGRFKSADEHTPDVGASIGIGSPEQVRDGLLAYEEQGIDQVILVQQSGRTAREHIAESIGLFADRVMGEFKAREAGREARKQAELAPYIEAALARRRPMAPVGPDEVAPVQAFGRSIAQGAYAPAVGEATAHASAGFTVMTKDPAGGS